MITFDCLRLAAFGLILFSISSAALASGKVESVIEGDNLILQDNNVRLVINKNNFTLQQITDLVGHSNYVKIPGDDIFQIRMGDNPLVSTALSGQNFVKYKYRKINSTQAPGWELQFIDAPVQSGGTLSATVTITLDPKTSLYKWGLSIDNKSSTPLLEMQFPLLRELASDRPGSEKTDYVAVPAYSGVKYMSPRNTGIAGPGYTEVPSSGMSVQLMGYCDGQGGTLYLASYDSKYYHKNFTCWPMESKTAFYMCITHFAEKSAINSRWTLPYPIICGPIRGDWYDAAKLYRSWTTTLPKVKSLAVRTDIPGWFKNLSVWFQGATWAHDEDKLLAYADDMIDLRKKLGEPFGFHWYIWQKYSRHDYRYPDYLPAPPGFIKAARKMQEAGIYVMPYINIQLCDTSLPFWTEEKASEYARLAPTGKPYFEYGAGGPESPMVPMCVVNDYWQNKIMGIATHVVSDYSVDAIYWDEYTMAPYACYATKHKHPWSGGTYDRDAVDSVLRKTLVLKKNIVITGEGLLEVYIDKIHGQLNGHADMRADSLPIFQTVDADRTTEFGVWVNSGEINSMDIFNSKLAFNLVRGRQLAWYDRDLIRLNDPDMVEQIELLKKYSAARHSNLDFLYSGEFLRTPDLSRLSKAKRTWDIWPGTRKIDYDLPVVLAECYRSFKGDIGIVLANHTDTEQTISIPWNQKDWGIKIGTGITRTDWVSSKWSAPVTSKLTKMLNVTVPARSPAVIKIALRKN